ncbi:MAG: hypothetical protein J1E40_03500 [Oscillospiraceae bacterium]|nr:hypothetical protein [Oscillospiraceae bacterium]
MSFGDIFVKFMEILSNVLFFICIFWLPIAILIWFIVSLVNFLRCPKENDYARKRFKRSMIISGTICGIMLLAVIALVVILSLAVMNM